MSNKTCGECKHHKEKCHCEKFGCYAGESDFCDEFEPAKKQIITNGDVIRQGSNKELVIFKKQWDCNVCAYYQSGCKRPKDKMCLDGMLAWLNAPADCVAENSESAKQADLCCKSAKESEEEDE
jgi:hypothetical protein